MSEATGDKVYHTFEVGPPEVSGDKSSTASPGRFQGLFEDKDKDIQYFQGYCAPLYKKVLYYLLGVCTAGLLFLACKWSTSLYIALRLKKCQLRNASHVKIVLTTGHEDLELIQLVEGGATGRASLESSAWSQGDVDGQALLGQAGQNLHRLLEYRGNRYFYVDAIGTFAPVAPIPKTFNESLRRTAQLLASSSGGLSLLAPTWDLWEREVQYGANQMKIPVKSLSEIIYSAMWHPFYVFQYFSVLVWIFGDNYYSYAVCIMLITWFSIISEAVQERSNMLRLAKVAQYTCEVNVLRGGDVKRMDSTCLVPGDVVVMEVGVLPCDMVLLRGECIVDENMLTGESVPVRKVSYSPTADAGGYDPDKCPGCTLFGGTQVAQARAKGGKKAFAMVVRTRFYSAKGELLKSILYPREHSESFVSDSLRFIAMMLAVCLLLYTWSATTLASVGAGWVMLVVRLLDMVTIAVPPALPACLTIAIVFSINRLKKQGIYVTGADRIPMAGQLDVMCFDKTGTLTEQGLDLLGVSSISQGTFQPLTAVMAQLPTRIVQLLATCHGLAHLGGELVGDPLDQKLFQATGWDLHDDKPQGLEGYDEEEEEEDASVQVSHPQVHVWASPPLGEEKYTVVHRFEFSSKLQRNVVVVRGPQPGAPLQVFVKGSPEALRTLVVAESVPEDFDQVLGEYTREGLRVLAVAAGELGNIKDKDLHAMTQEQVESSMPLLLVGLVVMANPLRKDSAGVIQALQKAQIRCVMVTGDHIRTAISVAHQCYILADHRAVCLVDASTKAEHDHSISIINTDGTIREGVSRREALMQVLSGELQCAITGKGFDRLLQSLEPDITDTVLNRASVFARMSPDNKRDLMELLGNGISVIPNCPHLGLKVGFCGDGANDCGALKAAHVGVSLCEAEASVAAPMTSRKQTIASMVTVIAEGRCTLMATYQIFQFIIGYALVQAFSTNLCYHFALDLGDVQYLVQDLIFTTVLAALMGYTEPRTKLADRRPLNRVMSLPLILDTALQLVVVVTFQILAVFVLLRNQPGYVPARGTPDLRTVKEPEVSTLYLLGLAQYIVLALVFNKGAPHRKELYTNLTLLGTLTLQVIFVLYTLLRVDRFTKWQEVVGYDGVMTVRFRQLLLLLMVTNGVLAFFTQWMGAKCCRAGSSR